MKRTFSGAATLVVVALIFTLVVGAAGAKPPAPGVNNTCPTNTKGLATANNVGATASTTGNTTTYTFDSFVNQNPVGGVPGLINYCVYPDKPSSTVTASAVGADGSKWRASEPGNDFGFSRPGGDPTNIPLDGTTGIAIGSATWANVPTKQTIVLHINDSSKCGTSPTCFVLPGAKPGPVCNAAGDLTGVGYSSIPKDVTSCSPPSEAFEATSTREFGDEVVVNPATGHITSLTVDFQSYGCGDGGHWYLGQTDPCKTTAGETFNHPITAHIYAASSGGAPGALLGSASGTFTIPFRPSADPTNCPGGAIPAQGIEAGSQWFNPAFGTCQYSISKLLTFNFSGSGIAVPSGGDVIWTVEFNTSDYGASPLAPQPCNSDPQGCGYDSLNVGTKTYSTVPFVGTDVDPNGAFLSSTWAGAYCDNGAHGTGFLRLDTGTGLTTCWYANPAPDNTDWLPYRPLAQINLGP